MVDKGIKIQNIYYMLAYAFQVLKNDAYEKLGSEDFENTADLLSAILAKGISIQVKRGLGKEYIPLSEPLTTLRGKIDIAQSIKGQTMIKKQLVCNYDEFSTNSKLHQIIKTTVAILLKTKDVPKPCKKGLKNLMMYFGEVETLNPYTIDWNIRFHRNNQSYQMLINICYLVIKGLLQKDENGDMKMQKFLDEQRMCRLYEKFIWEYYKKHFSELRVSSSQIKWGLDEENEYMPLLPTMQSDIMLQTKDGTKTLIIDAKYYTKSMTKRQFSTKETFHSHNLYQIFTYVKNATPEKYGKVSGMLLYAKTGEEITPDAEFSMSGNMIYVKSLDLGGEFSEISNQLNTLANHIFN